MAPLSPTAGEPVAKRRRMSRSSSQDSVDPNLQVSLHHHNNNNHGGSGPGSEGGLRNEGGPNNGNGGVGCSYCGELVMFDRHGRCLLTAGHYELMLEPPGASQLTNKASPKKNASWESIDTLKLDGVFTNIPVLKFTLNWNSENSNAASERPRLRPLKPLDLVLANSTSTKPKPQGESSGPYVQGSW